MTPKFMPADIVRPNGCPDWCRSRGVTTILQGAWNVPEAVAVHVRIR